MPRNRDHHIRISEEERELLDEAKEEVPRLKHAAYGEIVGQATEALLEQHSEENSGDTNF